MTSGSDAAERSPIFVQFLDAVYQCLIQQPDEFEFNQRLLWYLAREAHTCRFGTFLGCTERERKMWGLPRKTVSVWSEVLHYEDAFRNRTYRSPQEGQPRTPLLPDCSSCAIRLWKEYHCDSLSPDRVSAFDRNFFDGQNRWLVEGGMSL
jgi:hypothetical protein